MRNMPGDPRQKRRARHLRRQALHRAMADGGTDVQFTANLDDAVKAGNRINIDQMRRLGETKRHDRRETLPAGEDAPAHRRNLRQQ